MSASGFRLWNHRRLSRRHSMQTTCYHSQSLTGTSLPGSLGHSTEALLESFASTPLCVLGKASWMAPRSGHPRTHTNHNIWYDMPSSYTNSIVKKNIYTYIYIYYITCTWDSHTHIDGPVILLYFRIYSHQYLHVKNCTSRSRKLVITNGIQQIRWAVKQVRLTGRLAGDSPFLPGSML